MSRPSHVSRKCPAVSSTSSFGRHALRLGGALHLQAVLVGAGQIEDLVAPEPAPAREDVTGDGRVGVTDVRDVVDVVDGGGDVEAGHGGSHCARRSDSAATRSAGLGRQVPSALDLDHVAELAASSVRSCRRGASIAKAERQTGREIAPRRAACSGAARTRSGRRTRRRSGSASRTCAPAGTAAGRAHPRRRRDR